MASEGDKPATEVEEAPGIIGYIKRKFSEAEEGKRSDEGRWTKAYKNYRGVYDSSTQFKDSERSRVFVKVTKTKVLAAYGQIVDILFANGKVPITIENTPVPEGIAEFAHLDVASQAMQQQQQQPPMPAEGSPNVPQDPVGYEGDGRTLEAGAIEASDPQQPQQLQLGGTVGQDTFLGGLSGEYGLSSKLKPGIGRLGEPQIEPAAIAARNMQKVIQDQLIETSAITQMRHSIFECALLGTGILKGPFNYNKRYMTTKVGPDGKTTEPKFKLQPKIEAVSCWDFYPDPSAISMDDCEFTIERHKYNRSQLRDLKQKPLFNLEAIDKCLSMGPNYQRRGFEDDIYSDEDPTYVENRFEVLEYWGILDRKFLDEIGISVPAEMTDLEELQVNVWICGNEVLRAIVNPFTPAKIPYHSFPYELHPYQFFGIGVPENMDDAQMIMNGHMRMAIDNLSLAGNMVFDIDETMLVPGQSMTIHPGKIFRRQSGQPGAAVAGLKFPNTAGENIQMYDKARQLADEETGIPSIVHGQTGVTGTGRTAAGLSMLLSSAGLNVKTVIKNIDDYLLKPLGESFFNWNMQFNDNSPEIKGDIEVKATGTSSVMQKEVRTQRLTTLLQTIANPLLAPFIKIPNLVKELAISQDIDPKKLVNDPNEAAIFADILRGLYVQQETSPEATTAGQQPQGMGSPTRPPVGADPNDDSAIGGGNIGVGAPKIAGEAGFTGTPPEDKGSLPSDYE